MIKHLIRFIITTVICSIPIVICMGGYDSLTLKGLWVLIPSSLLMSIVVYRDYYLDEHRDC